MVVVSLAVVRVVMVVVVVVVDVVVVVLVDVEVVVTVPVTVPSRALPTQVEAVAGLTWRAGPHFATTPSASANENITTRRTTHAAIKEGEEHFLPRQPFIATHFTQGLGQSFVRTDLGLLTAVYRPLLHEALSAVFPDRIGLRWLRSRARMCSSVFSHLHLSKLSG